MNRLRSALLKLVDDLDYARAGSRLRDRASILCVLLLTLSPRGILLRHPRLFALRERVRSKVLVRTRVRFMSCDFATINSESLLYISGFFESRHFGYMESSLRGGTFVDVGANIGRYSVVMGKRYSGGRVVSLEPDPLNHSVLRHNVALNGLRNVELHRAAAWKEDGEVGLNLADTAGQHSIPMDFGLGREVVPALRLDTLLAGEARVDLIKIDVEGAEMEVLEGAARTILRHHPRLIIEVRRYNWQRLRSWLEERGYAWEVIPDTEIPPCFDVFSMWTGSDGQGFTTVNNGDRGLGRR